MFTFVYQCSRLSNDFSDDRCRTRLKMTRTTLDMNYSFLSLILSVFCDVLFIDSSFNLHHQLVVISLSVFLVTKKTNKGGTCSFFSQEAGVLWSVLTHTMTSFLILFTLSFRRPFLLVFFFFAAELC